MKHWFNKIIITLRKSKTIKFYRVNKFNLDKLMNEQTKDS